MSTRTPTETGKVARFRIQEDPDRQHDPLRRRGAGEMSPLDMARLVQHYVAPLYVYEQVQSAADRFQHNVETFLARHLRGEPMVSVDTDSMVLYVVTSDDSGEFHYGFGLHPAWFKGEDEA